MIMRRCFKVDYLEKINDEIYKMEQELLNMIQEKVDLFDSEVIAASEKLDSILEQYANMQNLS